MKKNVNESVESSEAIEHSVIKLDKKKLTWETPSVLGIEISSLTAGFSPNLKDIPIPGLGAS